MIGSLPDLQMNVDARFALCQRKELHKWSAGDLAIHPDPYAKRAILEDLQLGRGFGTGMESAFEIKIAAQFVEMA